MLATVEQAVERRAWGNAEELLAVQVELLHALWRAFILANTDASTRPNIDPLVIPRPGRPAVPKTITLDALAHRMMSGR